jgi:hypothetical protein
VRIRSIDQMEAEAGDSHAQSIAMPIQYGPNGFLRGPYCIGIRVDRPGSPGKHDMMRNHRIKSLRDKPRADVKKEKTARKQILNGAAPLIICALCFGIVFCKTARHHVSSVRFVLGLFFAIYSPGWIFS